MIRTGTLEEAYEVFINIPEFDQYLSLEDMKDRVAGEYLVTIAEVDGVLVGFKIGYAKSDTEFYSWLGAVLPKYRRSGVAQDLLTLQDSSVKDLGYRKISVKSMNRFKSMLLMLIKNGYSIASVESFGDPEKERINLVKVL